MTEITMKERLTGRSVTIGAHEATKRRILSDAGWVQVEELVDEMARNVLGLDPEQAENVLYMDYEQAENVLYMDSEQGTQSEPKTPAEPVVGILREDVSGLLPADFKAAKPKRTSSMKQAMEED